jgi:hypothetical protein
MEDPTVFYTRIAFLTVALVSFVFIVFLAGVIGFFRKSSVTLSQEKHELLQKPLLSLGLSGFGMIVLISCCWGITFIPILISSYQYEKISCREMPVSDGYKLVIEDRRNGERKVYLDNYDGSERFIWAITRFAVHNKYMIGETSLLQYDRDYFWINLESKEVFDTRAKTDLEGIKESAFRDSLSKQGIFELPDMISVYTLCKNDDCTSCNAIH